MPAAVRGIDVPDDEEEGGETTRHLMVENADGLLGLIQMSVLELHPWGCHPNLIEEPDRIIFDLDPGPDVPWRAIIDGATMLRDALKQIGLTSFLRTSGGKGLHVLSPLMRGHTWGQCARFAKAVADTMVRIAPRRFVSTYIVEQRQGRIYIDHLRNARGSTAIASYSLRARPGAPVALPIGWDELAGLESASAFKPPAVLKRIASGAPDPWAGFTAAAARLPS
jgi:bifunctional non-homologous end joining protein LigD